jgi:hypothetical protein
MRAPALWVEVYRIPAWPPNKSTMLAARYENDLVRTVGTQPLTFPISATSEFATLNTQVSGGGHASCVLMVLSAIFGLASYVGLYFSPENNVLDGVLLASVVIFVLAFVRFLIAAVVAAGRSR